MSAQVNYSLNEEAKTPNGRTGSPANSDSDSGGSDFQEAEDSSSDDDEPFRERRPDHRRSGSLLS